MRIRGWRSDVCSSDLPATVLTIHNLAFQGLFDADRLPRLGLPADCFSPDGIEFYGRISFLKAGISHADRLTTVSRTCAKEIQTLEFGCGSSGTRRVGHEWGRTCRAGGWAYHYK